jgi:hypothetical protein
MNDITDAAQGKSSIIFNFPQPGAATDYTLTLTLHGISKTKTFTVVPQAYVKSIQITNDSNYYEFSDDKQLTFKVVDYSQKQANQNDIENIKWITIFFEGMHFEDYKEGTLKIQKSGDSYTALIGSKTATSVELYTNKGNELIIPAGKYVNPDTKGDFQKGLYFVEAFKNIPEGKKGAMDYYELTINEPKTIKGPGMMRPWVPLYQGGPEKFAYEVSSWLTGTPPVKPSPIHWALYDAAGTTKVLDFVGTGEKVELSPLAKAGEYQLKAWVGDFTRAASLSVKIEWAEILAAFFADSSGREINHAGKDDIVYFYMKTTGLQDEEVIASIFGWGGAILSGIALHFVQLEKVKVDRSGIIFQSMQLKKSVIDSYTWPDGIRLAPVMTFPASSKILVLGKTFETGEYKNYYSEKDLVPEHILNVSGKEEATGDFDFIDPATGHELRRPILYGEKVKVRVRITNYHGKTAYIHLIGSDKVPVTLTESNTAVPVNDEGYAEMEFVFPKDMESSHGSNPKDFRNYGIYVSPDNVKVVRVPDWNNINKMLHVVKEALTAEELKGVQYLFPKTRYAELPASGGDELIWGSKVKVDFRQKVVEISARLNIDPNHLMTIMKIETAGTFDPAIKNPYGYVGLIQFGPDAASDLNTTTDALQKMTAVEQLEYVYRFLNKNKSKLTSFTRLYLAVIMPADIAHADDPQYVVFDAQSTNSTRRKGYWRNALYQREKGEKTNTEYVSELGQNMTGWKTGKTYMWEFTDALESIYNEGKDYAIGVNETKSLASIYAKKILDSQRVTFRDLHPGPNGPYFDQYPLDQQAEKKKEAKNDKANAIDAINDAAQDKPTFTSPYSHKGETEVPLNETFWRGFYKLSVVYTMEVSEITGGRHEQTTSRHYVGTALDIVKINGVVVDINNSYISEFMKNAISFGANANDYPHYDNGVLKHNDHIHLSWPRP